MSQKPTDLISILRRDPVAFIEFMGMPVPPAWQKLALSRLQAPLDRIAGRLRVLEERDRAAGIIRA